MPYKIEKLKLHNGCLCRSLIRLKVSLLLKAEDRGY